MTAPQTGVLAPRCAKCFTEDRMMEKKIQNSRMSEDPEKIPRILFTDLFGNERPVEVEIGCGKGKFLLARAVENPGVNFLGIDYAGKWMKIGQARGQKRRIENLRFLKGEARALLAGMAEESVDIFHVYFPDPWPKRRHQKRRLITPDFLKCLRVLLKPDGLIELATDDADYFSGIKKSVLESGARWRHVRESVNERLAFGTVRTSYEIKYAAENRPLYYLELQK
jgi:tRNA (guanine-N7-)-methyltransferase